MENKSGEKLGSKIDSNSINILKNRNVEKLALKK